MKESYQSLPEIKRARRRFIKNAAIAAGVIAIPGAWAYLSGDASRRSNETKNANYLDLQHTPIAQINATATARQLAIKEGRDPQIFTPEHGFTHEDYRQMKQAIFRLSFYLDDKTHLGGGTGWAIRKKDNTLSIMTNKHVVESFPATHTQHLSIVRPGIDDQRALGKHAYSIHADRDLAVITFSPEDARLLDSVTPLPYVNNAAITAGEYMMITGYPVAMADFHKFNNPIDSVPFADTDTLTEFPQVINPRWRYRTMYDKNAVIFEPWRNSAGGSGSPMAVKNTEGQLEVVSTFSGVSTIEYTDILGYQQKAVVGIGWKIDDSIL